MPRSQHLTFGIFGSRSLIVLVFASTFITARQPSTCKSCHGKTCPENFIPPYSHVAYPSSFTLERLNHTIWLNYELEKFKPQDVNLRTQLMDAIRKILLPTFPDTNLTLFGSIANGFGSRSSADADICLLTLQHNHLEVSNKLVIHAAQKVMNAFSNSPKIKNVRFVPPPATTPIVQFHHADFKLNGDIAFCSYYPRVLQDMLLVKAYVDFDARVAPLGVFLKKLVKSCDIADAKTRTLFATGWTYMLIYFLQNHDVPVLPNLLQNVTWTQGGKNQESVAQLWLAFLDFFVKKFDYVNEIVSIGRFHSSLSTEPFYHEGLTVANLYNRTFGGVLGRTMTVHIIKTLQKFRIFFHRSTDNLTHNENSYLYYYTDPKNICKGNLPTDMEQQGRFCNKEGVTIKNVTHTTKAILKVQT